MFDAAAALPWITLSKVSTADRICSMPMLCSSLAVLMPWMSSAVSRMFGTRVPRVDTAFPAASAVEIGRRVVTTMDAAGKAVSTLGTLVPNIRETAELIQGISTASKEQSIGIEQIRSAVLTLDNVIQGNAAAAANMADAVSALEDRAESLRAILSRIGENAT